MPPGILTAKLQASAARAYLHCKTKQRPTWLTPKQELNALCEWEALQWRRHILGLVYFHHLYFQFFSLLSDFGFRKSDNPRHPTSIILPRSGTYSTKSFLFQFSLAWNHVAESTRNIKSSIKFKKQVRADYAKYKYNLAGIPSLFQ